MFNFAACKSMKNFSNSDCLPLMEIPTASTRLPIDTLC
jgi:hypothetical protein